MDVIDYLAKLQIEYSDKIEQAQALQLRLEAKNRGLAHNNAPLSDRINVLTELAQTNAKIVAYTEALIDIRSIEQRSV